MVHILGGHDVAILGPLRFWSDRGLVHVEDSRDNSYETLTVRDVLLRAKGINDMIGNSSDPGVFYKTIKCTQDFLDRLLEVCRKAREQGMPTDPSAARDLARRRPTTVSMPADMESLPL